MGGVMSGQPTMTPLHDAVWSIETSRCPGDCPSGDNGMATGPLQIHKGCWSDVARPGEQYSDCADLGYSVEVFNRYMARYATQRRLGRTPTREDKARIWNGGPNGFKKKATLGYWAKVKTVLGGA